MQSWSPRSLTSETDTPLHPVSPSTMLQLSLAVSRTTATSALCPPCLLGLPSSKANITKVCSCLGIPPNDPPPVELRQNSSMGARDTLHCLIPVFISCLLRLHRHPELLTPTYWCLSQLGAFAHAVPLFWNVLLPFSDWKTQSYFMTQHTFHHLCEVTTYFFQAELFALSWSPTAFVYISVIPLIALYCNFAFQVSVTPLRFKIQEVKNLRLLIFYIVRV